MRNLNVDVSSIRKIAVIPFASDAAQRRISGEWETVLLSLGYRVVERGSIELVLKEQGMSLSGLVNPDQAAKIGEILGVEGLVTGTPNPRPPFHSYGIAGTPRLSEPPPTSIKLLYAMTARVIWSVAGKEMSGESVSVAQQGRAVDVGVEISLRKVLKAGNWSHFPLANFKSRSAGSTVVAFSANVKHTTGMRIGVYPFYSEGQPQKGQGWADKFAMAFMEAGYYVIDRIQMEKILREQKISLTGAIRPDDIIRIGKIGGLQGLVLGVAYGDPMCAYSLKLCHVETGEVYWSAYGDDCTPSHLTDIVKEFLEQMTQ
ncbi:MAG: hypothetical protein HY747_10845 [Elusimicrobia bacterium]|nr:hypothetical protein [Elusimicrobiota bacterium]